jgi:predicted dehydrogenase
MTEQTPWLHWTDVHSASKFELDDIGGIVRIALVGTGYVADYYFRTLQSYPDLQIVGAWDNRPSALQHFCTAHQIHAFSSYEELLAGDAQIVVNLTNPESHYEVSLLALQADKHVYSEKPLGMDMAQATELVALATQRKLYLSGAPCSLLGESAQTLWRELRRGRIGSVYCAYAEMDDGLVSNMAYRGWLSETGIPWPWKNEFETGCTLEHAGYYLAWFPAFFGPATHVTAMSSTLVKDKSTDEPLAHNGADFSVATVTFQSGVVVRLTCSIVAEHDHQLRVFGDAGTLSIEDSWFYGSPVKLQKSFNVRRRQITSPKLPVKMRGKAAKHKYRGSQQMDFAKGISELSESISQGRRCRLNADYMLHVNELVLAIHHAGPDGVSVPITSRFEAIEPMDWAR